MSPEQSRIEARARIIWGESPTSVREFLISNGIPRESADAQVDEMIQERNRELRAMGLRDVVIGCVLSGSVGITTWLLARHIIFQSIFVKMYAFVLLVGTYGLWKLGKGIVYLVRPQSEHKSIADINQDDLVE